MKNVKVVWVMFALLITPVATIALPLNETVETVADCLVKNQDYNGAWSGEWGYTGSILAGVVQAYEVKEKASYKEAAELSVIFILETAGGNFYGDEAYALARMTEVTGDPVYADIVLEFYNGLDTHEYLRGFNATTPEKSTFFISFHTVASYMVGAKDASIWREALISHLANVGDDISYFPVMTLGVATWALAQTGPLDDTMIDPFGLSGVSYWEGVKLSDLPDILLTHQVLSGEYAGSFYVRFDHTAPGLGYEAAGYTEDTVYGLLGLIAADAIVVIDDNGIVEDAGWDFGDAIQSAREAVVQSVHQSGLVQEHICLGSQMYYLFGGELLQTLSE